MSSKCEDREFRAVCVCLIKNVKHFSTNSHNFPLLTLLSVLLCEWLPTFRIILLAERMDDDE